MSFDLHTISVLNGTNTTRNDRLVVGVVTAIANAAGSGAGSAVTTTVTPGGNLPSKFTVVVNPGQDATWYVNNKTDTSFDVVLTPRLAASTLAAGTFDLMIIA